MLEKSEKNSKNSRKIAKNSRKFLKIVGRMMGYSHDWESVPMVRIKISTVRTKTPMVRTTIPSQ